VAQRAKTDVWISRAVLVLSACLIALACFLVWRISMVVYRLEQAVVSVGADVRQVTATGVRLSELVDRLADRVERLERKSEGAIGMDELESALDELKDLREGLARPREALSAEAEGEIRYLLRRIHGSGLQFALPGKFGSASRAYVHLTAKFQLYRSTLTSAEDFIRTVASQTVTGHPYYVKLEDGGKIALDAWLGEQLAEYRAKQGQSAKPDAPPQQSGVQHD